ncbi:MAG TPA: hypothetical protein VF074_06800, partial [Pyrinomonadaceae bacterium]
QFFNYFLVEKLFGGNRHFGINDEQVIESLTNIYCRGFLQDDNRKQSRRTSQKKPGSFRGSRLS